MNNQESPLIFGEVLYDHFVEDGKRVLGGAPFNVAWHLQGFGLNPVFVSRVGQDDDGARIKSSMQDHGMNIAAIQTDNDHPTGEVTITLSEGQPTFEILDNQAYDYIDERLLPDVKPLLLYHGSLGIRQPDSAKALATIIDMYNPPVFIDVNLREPWWNKETGLALFKRASWVKINDDEIHALVDGNASLMDKACSLRQQYDLELLILTEGKKGARAIDRSGNVYSVNPDAETTVVDTVGAGDAFAAVCITGILSSWPVQNTLDRAQAFASLIVQQRGATINDTSIYKNLLQEWAHSE